MILELQIHLMPKTSDNNTVTDRIGSELQYYKRMQCAFLTGALKTTLPSETRKDR